MWDWLGRLWRSAVPEEAANEAVESVATQDEIKALNAFHYEVTRARLDAQTEYRRAIDRSTTSYFTIGSTVLPIVGGFLSTERSLILDCRFAVYALFAGFVFYVALAIFYVWSLRYGQWNEVPDMKK